MRGRQDGSTIKVNWISLASACGMLNHQIDLEMAAKERIYCGIFEWLSTLEVGYECSNDRFYRDSRLNTSYKRFTYSWNFYNYNSSRVVLAPHLLFHFFLIFEILCIHITHTYYMSYLRLAELLRLYFEYLTWRAWRMTLFLQRGKERWRFLCMYAHTRYISSLISIRR